MRNRSIGCFLRRNRSLGFCIVAHQLRRVPWHFRQRISAADVENMLAKVLLSGWKMRLNSITDLGDGSYAVVAGFEVFAECECLDVGEKNALVLASAFGELQEGKNSGVNILSEMHVGDAMLQISVVVNIN